MFNYVDLLTRARWFKLANNDGKSERPTFWRTVPELPSRPRRSHKGTFGTTLIVAGSNGMAGAAGLAGAAALRAGSGLTRIIVPETIQNTVAGYEREYTTIGAPCDARGRLTLDAVDLVLEEARNASVVAVGPGLGRSEALDELVCRLFFELEKPAVFDADALNALAEKKLFDVDEDSQKSKVDVPKSRRLKAPRVLTPHPGEFARLFGFKPDNDVFSRLSAAQDASNRTFRYPIAASEERSGYESCVVVLKGSGTIIAQTSTQVEICDDEGSTELKPFDEVCVNKTGNACLATGGSGDVLTGIVAGLIAQGLGVAAAAKAGTALHGVAAELQGTVSLRGAVASDIIAFLPYAFVYYEQARRTAIENAPKDGK